MAYVGILLAAGRSRRFGAHKLLHPLADGVPIAVAAGRNLIRALPNSLAVVRPGDSELIAALSAVGLTILESPLSSRGLGSSLAAGVRNTVHADGWLIALADMPWVKRETICGLMDGLRDGAAMIAPAYQGRRGHPVGFASVWGPRLQQLSGDEGARGLIAEHSGQLLIQATGDAGVVMDIDYPQDVEKSVARRPRV